MFRLALPRWGAGAAVLTTLAVTLAASILVHYLVERPLRATARGIARRLRPTRARPGGVCRLTQAMAPRAATGHRHATTPLRTPTYQS